MSDTYSIHEAKREVRSPERVVQERLLKMKCDPLRGMVRCIKNELAALNPDNALLFHMYEKLMKWSTLRTVSIALPAPTPPRNERVIDLNAMQDFSALDSKSLGAAIAQANRAH